jgi:hypothetical protein
MASTAVRYPTPQRVDGSTQHTSVEVTDPLLCPPELDLVTRVSHPCICLCWGGIGASAPCLAAVPVVCDTTRLQLGSTTTQAVAVSLFATTRLIWQLSSGNELFPRAAESTPGAAAGRDRTGTTHSSIPTTCSEGRRSTARPELRNERPRRSALGQRCSCCCAASTVRRPHGQRYHYHQ